MNHVTVSGIIDAAVQEIRNKYRQDKDKDNDKDKEGTQYWLVVRVGLWKMVWRKVEI
jgi:hypothetical protein